MCGIAGFIDFHRALGASALSGIATAMGEALVHRGPDDHGVWTDEKMGVALAFRRLAIIDCSMAGHQPMRSSNGRYVLVYNGEIYNHGTLQKELAHLGHDFRGHSDTEVLLAAFQEWGVNAALQRCNGMFAFALWDTEERVLRIGRDRLGIKPLYYARKNGVFFFASELKALLLHPRFNAEIDRNALALYLRYGYVPEPFSIYQDAAKLRPGFSLTIHADRPSDELTPTAYWDSQSVVSQALQEPYLKTESAALFELECVVKDAVSLRMISDVPLGAFLSGGIDSSLVVSMMQSLSQKAIKTFTIGFNESNFNEATEAAKIARHLKTDHTELYVSPNEARDVIPRLPSLYDEPFGDSSQIPTFLVSQLAKKDVTVALSGDGGDELFAGYNRYVWTVKLWNLLGRWPQPLKRPLLAILTRVPSRQWDQVFKLLQSVLPRSMRQKNVGEKLQKLAQMLSHSSPQAMYQDLISSWKSPNSVLLDGFEPPIQSTGIEFQNIIEEMMYTDMTGYLPGDILTKVDRASMGVSLEVRTPLLDYRVVELAWRLPLSMKMKKGVGKYLLKELLYRYVPASLIDRPKMGFGVPVGEWLRGPLRDWAEDLLSEERLNQEGYFKADQIREKWKRHVSGECQSTAALWNVLMFQAWISR